MPQEMDRLRSILDEMGIKWCDKTERHGIPGTIDLTIYRTHFTYKGKIHSVICGYVTYGGQEGLLEMMIGNNDPSGWHTAEDIIEIMKGEKE